MPPGTKHYPTGESVVITDTFNATTIAGVAANKQAGFNEELPPSPRGIYIGGDNGQTYDVYIEESDGSIVPHLQMAPGIVHPVYPRRIIDRSARRTTAINLLIKY